MATLVDLTTPANSRLLAAVSGGSPTHPFKFPDGAPGLAALTGYVEAAATLYAADGGGVTPPPGPSPYNAATFDTQIMPMFEQCATAGCHATSGCP